MIRLENLGFRLKSGKYLVQDVNLQVAPGEVLAVIGPNGAGKSSMLKILSGDYRATDGAIHWHGCPLEDWPARMLSRNRGVLPQISSIPFAFTSLELVLLGRSPYSGGESQHRKIALEMLERMDAMRFAYRTVNTLSGGELQRVQLARVLAQIENSEPEIPQVLLLDEPTSNLDPCHQHALLKLATERARQGCSVVVVLHDLNLASQYADTIALLAQGKLRYLGTPEEVFQPEIIQEVFNIEVMIHKHPSKSFPYLIPL